MPSAIRKQSFGSVTIFSVDKELIWQALERYVARLRERPEVLAVVLFGSLHEGGFGVGSDVDLLIVLAESSERFLDRTVTYRPVDFPVDMDVFPYTVDEIRAGQPLARTALTRGRVLWQRPGFDLDGVVSDTSGANRPNPSTPDAP